MNDLPNFSEYGYQITEILGTNIQGGRVTYKALYLETQEWVVIKQFKFITGKGSWSDYQAIEQETKILKQINHPFIPRYLGNFDSGEGFCLVQEYKDALLLSQADELTPHEVKTLATNLLEILVYLQKQKPPIIHRDIKPENILITPDLQVYLIDFGFARIGGKDLGLSSTIKGTMGFMPPEQILNRPLTKASDLYSLGVTLISLLTKTPSHDIGSLIDINFQVKFQHLIPELNPNFIDWLTKIVDAKSEQRFQDATQALKALKPLSIKPLTEIELHHYPINLTATKIDEILNFTLTVNENLAPHLTEGKWQVMPHLSDPPHNPDSHSWIYFQPHIFTRSLGKDLECHLVFDTSKLRANKVYQRKILLESTTSATRYILPVKIKTAPIVLTEGKFPYLGWCILLISSLILSIITIIWTDVLLSLLNHIWLFLNQVKNLDYYNSFANNIILCINLIIGGGIAISYEKGKSREEMSSYLIFLIFFSLFYALCVGVICLVLMSIITLFQQKFLEMQSDWLWIIKASILSGQVGGFSLIIFITIGYLLQTFIDFNIKLIKAGLNVPTSFLFISLNCVLGFLIALKISGYNFTFPLVISYLITLILIAIVFLYLTINNLLKIKAYKYNENIKGLIKS